MHERIVELETFVGRYCYDPGSGIDCTEVLAGVRAALQGFASTMAGHIEGLGERTIAPPSSWNLPD
jgi:hypothetical protein